jgi:hypothetical protein
MGNIRKLAFEWWSKLSNEELLKIESEFFDGCSDGEITDIDIESMYLTYLSNSESISGK